MINEHNQIICDMTGIILEDGVTLHDKYLEVKNRKVYQIISDDPNNHITPDSPKFKLGMLKNRVEYKRATEVGDAPSGLENDKHFIDHNALENYINAE